MLPNALCQSEKSSTWTLAKNISDDELEMAIMLSVDKVSVHISQIPVICIVRLDCFVIKPTGA